MARFRSWLRSHIVDLFRGQEGKKNTPKRGSWTKGLVISTPITLGTVSLDIVNSGEQEHSNFLTIASDPAPIRRSQYSRAEQPISPSIHTVFEHKELHNFELPPNILPHTATSADLSSTYTTSPSRRPTASRNFSCRFSTFSSHSDSSTLSSGTRRISQMSGLDASSYQDSGYGGTERRSSKRWSGRMSGMKEEYQTHTRNFTPILIV